MKKEYFYCCLNESISGEEVIERYAKSKGMEIQVVEVRKLLKYEDRDLWSFTYISNGDYVMEELEVRRDKVLIINIRRSMDVKRYYDGEDDFY